MAKRKAMSPGMVGDESFQMYGIVYWDETAAGDEDYNPIFASQTEDLLYAAGYYLARNQQDRIDHCAAMLEQCKVSPAAPQQRATTMSQTDPEREAVYEGLFYECFGNYNNLTKTLSEAIAWLSGLLEKVPPEFNDATRFEIESDRDDDGGYNTALRIGYWRPITGQEISMRESEEATKTAQRITPAASCLAKAG